MRLGEPGSSGYRPAGPGRRSAWADVSASTSGSPRRDELSLWKATDELLRRPVTIHLLPRGVPVPRHVVEAVQAAARVSDPRLATIYDTDFSVERPYIVSEWTRGTHLEDLVLSGLPSPALAAAMIADAADALAVAHRAGLPHLCLGARSLRWDTSSGLKITGLGIDAALSGTNAADPAAADTLALARMLYALLTGFWPGDEPTALPAAPKHKGRVYTPRQVRAGVPGVLDAITCHALQLQPPGAPRPVLTPAGLAMALHSVWRPSYSSFRPAGPAGCAPVLAQDTDVPAAGPAREELAGPGRDQAPHHAAAPGGLSSGPPGAAHWGRPAGGPAGYPGARSERIRSWPRASSSVGSRGPVSLPMSSSYSSDEPGPLGVLQLLGRRGADGQPALELRDAVQQGGQALQGPVVRHVLDQQPDGVALGFGQGREPGRSRAASRTWVRSFGRDVTGHPRLRAVQPRPDLVQAVRPGRRRSGPARSAASAPRRRP